MPKRFIVLKGSPRRGCNSDTLANQVIKTLRRNGAPVEETDLSRLENKVGGCCGCYRCKTTQKCVIPDETARLMNRLTKDFDGIVFAFPIYMFGMPAQVKAFIDRMLAKMSYDADGKCVSPLKNLCWAMIVSSGDSAEESGLEALKLQMEYFSDYIGGQGVHYLHRGNCDDDGEHTAADAGKMAEADRFAEMLLQQSK